MRGAILPLSNTHELLNLYGICINPFCAEEMHVLILCMFPIQIIISFDKSRLYLPLYAKRWETKLFPVAISNTRAYQGISLFFFSFFFFGQEVFFLSRKGLEKLGGVYAIVNCIRSEYYCSFMQVKKVKLSLCFN
jgi:hypothetical protein